MVNELITQVEIDFIIALILSVFAGFIIGTEREARRKDAGVSTHTFVIVGSMLFTFMSLNVDPTSTSRIAAQIVSGIGFLGAGIILRQGINIRNLTTAASIWFAGAIGMSFGFGYYFVGLVATIVSVVVPRMPHMTKRGY